MMAMDKDAKATLLTRCKDKPELLKGCEVEWNGRSGTVIGLKEEGAKVRHRIRSAGKVLVVDLRKRSDLKIINLDSNAGSAQETKKQKKKRKKKEALDSEQVAAGGKKRKSFAQKPVVEAKRPAKKIVVLRKKAGAIDDIFGELQTKKQEREEVCTCVWLCVVRFFL